MSYAIARDRNVNNDINKLYPEDRSIYEWYRFVLSFPQHLVRTYLERFGVTHEQRVLDPFCGTGTVLVECKKLGIGSTGIEANPMAHPGEHSNRVLDRRFSCFSQSIPFRTEQRICTRFGMLSL